MAVIAAHARRLRRAWAASSQKFSGPLPQRSGQPACPWGSDRRSSGAKIGVYRSAQPVRACQNSVISRQETASALIPVPISGRRPSRPAFESMIERGRALIAEQPRDLRERHPRIVEILGRKAASQLVDNLAVCCPFISQPSREGAQAEGQSLRHVFGFAFPCGQQLLHLGLNRRAQRSRFCVLLRRSGLAVGSEDAEQLRIRRDQRKVEDVG